MRRAGKMRHAISHVNKASYDQTITA